MSQWEHMICGKSLRQRRVAPGQSGPAPVGPGQPVWSCPQYAPSLSSRGADVTTDASGPVPDDRDDWWQSPLLDRLLADLLAAELARMRLGRAASRIVWDSALPLGDGGLGADSLERLRLAEAVAQALDLPDAPDALLSADTLGHVAGEVRRLLPQAGGGITFLTSGSTGRPKAVRQDLRLLWQEVEHLASLLPETRRILSLVPAQAIYGVLHTVLLPQRLGVPVIDLRDQRPGTLPALVQPGDLVVATPPAWTAMAGRVWPDGVMGVTSGAPCPPDTFAELRAGGLGLLEIYGASETGGIALRHGEREPFRLLPYWERDGDQLRREAGGAALVAEMPDHVEWLGPDLLRPLGRRDGAVQIAGVNVHPERVRAVLLAHLGVAEARVRLMRPDEGDWLKAFVVAREGVEATGLRAALEDWTRRRLTAPERPRAITLGTVLPVTPSGKPADWFIEEA